MTFTAPTAPLFPTMRGRQLPTRHILSSTQRELAYSGQGSPFPQWSIPKYQFEVPFSFVKSGDSDSDWAVLEGFIKKVKFAPGCLFRHNFSDDSLAVDQVFGTGDGATLSFQLLRSVGGFAEPVYCPNAITNVKADGTEVDAADYDVSNRGVVSFHSGHAPSASAVLTWNGGFDWYCTFDNDDEVLDNFAQGYFDVQKIVFTTSKMRAA
jgi:hypothetical protein